MSNKSLEQLTALLLRKTAAKDGPGQEGHGLSQSLTGGHSESSALVRRFLLKRGPKALEGGGDDAGAVVPVSAAGALDTSGLDRQLARARVAVLAKKPTKSDSPTLSEMMSD